MPAHRPRPAVLFCCPRRRASFVSRALAHLRPADLGCGLGERLRNPGRFDMRLGDDLLDNHALGLRDDVDNLSDPQAPASDAVVTSSLHDINSPTAMVCAKDSPDHAGGSSGAASKKERDREEEENECCVCMDRPVQVRFDPCNHSALCRKCAVRLLDRRCPLCRAAVKQVVDLPEPCNAALKLIFASMLLQHRAKNTKCTIGGEGHDPSERVRKKRKLQAESSEQAAGRFRDGSGRLWVTQEEVFGVLMAFYHQLKPAEACEFAHKNLRTQVKAMTAAKYCNIPDVIVDDFFRASDVCYYLFKITPNAGSFENKPYLAQYFPKLDSFALSGANLNNDAAKRLAELLARNKTLLTSLRELDVSRNKIQEKGLLALVNDFVLDKDRPPVFPFTLNWAEQNHSGSCLDFAYLRSQITLSPNTSHGLVEVQERVFRVG